MCPATDLTPCGLVSVRELHASSGLLKRFVLGIKNYSKGRLMHECWLKP